MQAASNFGGEVKSAYRRETNGGVKLSLRHAFGSHGNVRDNVAFVSERQVAYPVGRHIAVFDTERRSMEFLQKSRNVRKVLAMAISSNLKYVALCESTRSEHEVGGSAQVTVYHAHQQKRLHTMNHISHSDFVSCCFTSDSKHVITVSGAPSLQLVFWRWDAERAISIARLPSAVTRVGVNPMDSSQVTTSGPMHLRLWRHATDGGFKPQTLLSGAKEQENFTDHVWLRDKLVAATEHGTVLVFVNTRASRAEAASNSTVAGQSVVSLVQTIVCPLPDFTRIESLAAYSKGFILCGTSGFFSVYERTEERKDPFLLIKSFCAPQRDTICSVSVSPSDESVACFMRGNQLLSFPLVNIDIMAESGDNFAPLSPLGSHSGSVIAMDVCISKPIAVTAAGGSDRSVRIWNYLDWACELHQPLPEEPTALACHPNGFQILVGFKERLRLYNVLMTKLCCARETSVKHCKDLMFSHGGQHFAAAIGITVAVYDTSTFAPLLSFPGHIGPVKRVVWAQDDRTLFSAGVDGGVYGWSLDSQRRVETKCHVTKTCQYSGLACSSDGESFVACGSDEKLREVRCGDVGDDAVISSELLVGDDTFLTSLVLSHNNKHLFAGTDSGCVRVYSWPLTDDFQEYPVHNGSVSQLRITADDHYLFSAGEDGTVFALEVTPLLQGVELVRDGPDRTHLNIDAVLVSKEEMSEKLSRIANMEKKLADMRSESAYTLHVKDSEWGEQLKLHRDEFETALAAERERYEALQLRHESYVREQLEAVEKRDADHMKVTQEMENEYEHKLALEMARFDQLSEATERMRQECRRLLDEQQQQQGSKVAELTARHNTAVTVLQEKVAALHQDLGHNRTKFEEVLRQQEHEYELEIVRLKSKRRTDLETEQQSAALKQGQLNQQKNKNDKLRKRMKAMQDAAAKRDEQYAALKARFHKLQETLQHYERHLEEREATLADKERIILGLRSNNRTLDNFRYVLDHRIKQLGVEKGPISDHIDNLETHIRDMYEELVDEFQAKKAAGRTLNDKDLKIEALTNEVSKLRVSVREKDRKISSFCHDLTGVVKFTDSHHLGDALTDLYKLYVKGEKPRNRGVRKPVTDPEGGSTLGGAVGSEDHATVAEAARQRDYMENTVQTLKRTLKVADDKMRLATKTNMAENSILISECNTLRRENKQLKQNVLRLQERMKELRRRTASNSNHRPDSGRSSRRNSDYSARDSRPSTVGGLRRGSNGLPPTSSMPDLNHDTRTGDRSEPKATMSRPSSRSRTAGGRLIRGTTRPLVQAASTRGRVSGMLGQLDDNNRELEMQRIEIRRLREQVQILVDQLAGESHNSGVPPTPPAHIAPLRPPASAPSGQQLRQSHPQQSHSFAGSAWKLDVLPAEQPEDSDL